MVQRFFPDAFYQPYYFSDLLVGSVGRPHRFAFFCRCGTNIYFPSKQKRIRLCRCQSKQTTFRPDVPASFHTKEAFYSGGTSLNANGVGFQRPVSGSLYLTYRALNLDFTFISPKWKVSTMSDKQSRSASEIVGEKVAGRGSTDSNLRILFIYSICTSVKECCL